MIDIKLKGMLNQHTLAKEDLHNISNSDNHNVYSQLILANANSEMLSYMLNLNHQKLNDFKSMLAYNQINEAGLINEAQYLNEVSDSSVIKLPAPKRQIGVSITKVLSKRHSCRKFSSIPISKRVLSTLLHYSWGTSPRKIYTDSLTINTRYYASGGGLYPIKVYIYCNNVEDMKSGFYLYQPLSNTLLPLSQDKAINIDNFYEGEGIEVSSSNLSVFYGFRVSSLYLKYGELSLLLAIAEVGEMSQNFDLVATSLGLSGCTIAGFKKRYIENILDFDHIDEHILLSSICGKE
ncbi:SagB family peptide dehydrogenase [Lactobacillus intestinalis]|uniref:Nitroreductase domain-containing protein n=1 Tax=Lactobacillus intestinalis DSM 6629 TaxID=1423761 RepID=A0ABR5PSX2_9LACO|nr:SagB family peptide dehydrogenase [Lactobacillus intestinalis]KRM34676.1 hypothetical protein FC44_GL000995 [Lactobacillus intestinalis DSM 6629]UTW41081.1 SagB family peptide dehydrogenase [Lactobacillus intestinalis]